MMTELEERLAQPDGETLRAELMQRLGALAHRARLRLAEGIPQREYALWKKTSEAIQAADEVVLRWPVRAADDASCATLPAPHDTPHSFGRR